jgi:hypothetical protein
VSDAIYDQPFVVHTDDTEHELIGFVPGPAGVASADLGGVRVSVDYADPRILSSITAPTTEQGSDSEMLDVLIGADRAVEVRRRARAGGRPRRLDGVPPVRRPDLRQSSLTFGDTLEQEAVSKVTWLVSHAMNPSWGTAARAAALLEAATAVRRLAHQYPAFAAVGRRLTRQAGELLTDAVADLDRLVVVDRYLAERLAELCEGAGPSKGVEMASKHLRARLAAAKYLLIPTTTDLDPVDRTYIDTETQIRFVGDPVDGRMLVHVDNPDPDSWVRVLRRDNLTLVALAPVLHVEGHVGADVLVPLDLTTEDLVVELTVAPLTGRGSSLSKVAEAVELGRRAVEHQVEGRDRRSSEVWLLCAQRWDDLGDTARATLARQYADSDRRPWRVQLTAERIHAALRAG